MFKQQQKILQSAPKLHEIIKNYQWKSSPENWLQLAEEKSQNFSVVLPFVGAFSAGKSSLLNALVGERLFLTNIDPETAYPAELRYGETENIVGRLPNGSTLPLSREDLSNNLEAKLPPGSYVQVSLPHPVLAQFPHLMLVDMPGWDSGIQAHTAAIDNYADRSLAYCVVVSVDEGNLRESLRRALRELAVREMPILAVISKADKKPAEDVDAVAEQVRQEIIATMGRAPLAVVKASSQKKQLDELILALGQLEQQSEFLYERDTVQLVNNKLTSFTAHLETLINRDDLDSEKIQVEREQLVTDMAQFNQRLEEETQLLETRVKPVLGHILSHIRNALNQDLDSLADDAMHGDLEGSVGSIVRLATQRGISEEVTPILTRYLDRVSESLPDSFLPEINHSFEYKQTSGGGEEPALTVTPLVKGLLPAILTLIPRLNPIASVILGIVSILETFFTNEKKKQVEEARQREFIKRDIAAQVIPDVLSQVETTLASMLEILIQQAKQKISETIEAQRASHEAALQKLQAALEKGQANFAATRNQYQADLDIVTTIINGLGHTK